MNLLSVLTWCLPRRPAPEATDNENPGSRPAISLPNIPPRTYNPNELVRQGHRGRAQILRGVARHEPIPCLNSALVNQTLKKAPNHVVTSLGADNDHKGFTIYSFGQPPSQNIKCLEKGNESNALSEIRTMRDAKQVEPGDTESGKTHLFSGGFVACTPVIAFYQNGGIAMHHSARYTTILPTDPPKSTTNTEHLDPAHLDTLLNHPEFGRPTDLFVVGREGKQNQYTRQSGNAVYAINHAQPGTNVHVMEVPPRIVAVDVTPGNLDVWLT